MELWIDVWYINKEGIFVQLWKNPIWKLSKKLNILNVKGEIERMIIEWIKRGEKKANKVAGFQRHLIWIWLDEDFFCYVSSIFR